MALGDAGKSWLIFVLTGTIVVGGVGLKKMYDRWSETASELKIANESLIQRNALINVLQKKDGGYVLLPECDDCSSYDDRYAKTCKANFELGREITKLLSKIEESKASGDYFENAFAESMRLSMDGGQDLANYKSERGIRFGPRVKCGDRGTAFSQSPDDPYCSSLEELEQCRKVGFYYDESGTYIEGEMPGVDEYLAELSKSRRQHLDIVFDRNVKKDDFVDKIERIKKYSSDVREVLCEEDFAQTHREFFESLGKGYMRLTLDLNFLFGELEAKCEKVYDDQELGAYARSIKENLDSIRRIRKDLGQIVVPGCAENSN